MFYLLTYKSGMFDTLDVKSKLMKVIGIGSGGYAALYLATSYSTNETITKLKSYFFYILAIDLILTIVNIYFLSPNTSTDTSTHNITPQYPYNNNLNRNIPISMMMNNQPSQPSYPSQSSHPSIQHLVKMVQQQKQASPEPLVKLNELRKQDEIQQPYATKSVASNDTNAPNDKSGESTQLPVYESKKQDTAGETENSSSCFIPIYDTAKSKNKKTTKLDGIFIEDSEQIPVYQSNTQ